MLPAAVVLALATPSVADMRWERRVLIVSAPRAGDPALAAQRNALAGWRSGARDRDVTIVEVIADRTLGAADAAGDLRRRYRLDPARFGVVLIGKDGHVAMHSAAPVAAAVLQRRIDAMPMRRAGQR